MLKKSRNQLLAILFVSGILVSGATPTEAAKLQAKPQSKYHTAVIVVEDISTKEVVKVIDLSGIKKMSGAIKFLEDNAEGKNLRIVSNDPELRDSWQQATVEAGYKVKNSKNNCSKISDKAKRMLKKGIYYSFEIKNIVAKKVNFQDVVAWGLGLGTLIAAFQ